MPSLEAAAGAMTDASPEARWSADRLSRVESLISGQGQKAEAKRKVAANSEEV